MNLRLFLISITIIVIFSSYVYAGTIVLKDDFEDGTLPTIDGVLSWEVFNGSDACKVLEENGYAYLYCITGQPDTNYGFNSTKKFSWKYNGGWINTGLTIETLTESWTEKYLDGDIISYGDSNVNRSISQDKCAFRFFRISGDPIQTEIDYYECNEGSCNNGILKGSAYDGKFNPDYVSDMDIFNFSLHIYTNGSCQYIINSTEYRTSGIIFDGTDDNEYEVSSYIRGGGYGGGAFNWIKHYYIYVYNGTPSVNCTIAKDGMNITGNTTFCPTTYNLSNGITIQTNDTTLNCNGAKLIGNFADNIYAVTLNNMKNVNIKNCVIKNYKYGITLENKNSFINIENNTILNITRHGIFLYQNNTNNTIRNNRLINNSKGILLSYYSGNNKILNNYMENNGVNYCDVDSEPCGGIGLDMQAKDNEIKNNTFINNLNGFSFRWVEGNNITGNYIYNSSMNGVIFIDYETGSKNNNFWDNDFYYEGINETNSTENIFCIDCVGNRYYDNATGQKCLYECLFERCEKLSDIDCNKLQTLTQGWNLVGYCSYNKNTTNALSSIDGYYKAVFAYNASDIISEWESYHPGKPDFLNTLKNFYFGFGYWININVTSVNWTQ